MIEIKNKSEINTPAKIPTKLELLDMYNECRKKFKSKTLKYLSSIINLEYSAINYKENMSDEDILLLSNYEIYKHALVYNIYHKALNTFKEDKYLKVSNNQKSGEFFVQTLNSTIFDFNYGSKNKIITITKYIGEEKFKIMEIDNKIHNLEMKKNAYKYANMKKDIDICNQLINELLEARECIANQLSIYTNRQQKRISNNYFSMMKEEYGIELPENYNDKGKVVLKTMPSLEIRANIKIIE